LLIRAAVGGLILDARKLRELEWFKTPTVRFMSHAVFKTISRRMIRYDLPDRTRFQRLELNREKAHPIRLQK
jgi:hypothetical protein